MPRPLVVIALPPEELEPVAAELADAGFETLALSLPGELEVVLRARSDVALAILDGESDPETSAALYAVLHDDGRSIPALMVVSHWALERLAIEPLSANDEYFTRPYSADSLRWRVEAMCIRSQTVDDGTGPVIQSGAFETGEWARRATVVSIFNPKGGVGKTTIATNLAASLQVRKGQRVMLLDADCVTGHVTTSLGLEHVRTVADSWRDELEGGQRESLTEMSSAHPSGMRVVALTSGPLDTDPLDVDRIGDTIAGARRGFDYLIIDVHPSYSKLNRALFDRSDRILVPVTPDVPAIRAALQLREVAVEMGIGDRLSMVVNRANSGVSVTDMERTVGMPALALIRSGGLLFVRAANEGRTVVEMFPRERVTEDFDTLADKLLGTAKPEPLARPSFRLFNRQKQVVRA